MPFTSVVSTTVTNQTVLSGQAWEVVSGGVMSGTTVEAGGVLFGAGGVLSAGTSLTTNEGVIKTLPFGYLAIVGNVDNIGKIVASAGASSFADMLITGGTLSGGSGSLVAAVASATSAGAILELVNETVSGGTLGAGGSGAALELGDTTVNGAVLATLLGGTIGVLGGAASAGAPVSTTVNSSLVAKDSYIFDDGTLTFNGGAAQTGAIFNNENGFLTLNGMSFGAGDLLSASLGGVLTVSNSTNVFSAKTVVEAGDYGSAILSGGLINAGTISAYAAGGPDTFAGGTIYAGGAAVTNSAGGVIEAERVGGYGGTAYVNVDGSGTMLNAGLIEADAHGAYEGSAGVQVGGGSVTNTGTVEALATSDTGALGIVYGTSAVTNSGAMLATASDDADAYFSIATSGGTISNTKTIEASASDIASAGLVIFDVGSGSLVNAKNALIAVSATGGSTAYDEFERTGLFIALSGGIANSGTIELAVSDDSSANSSNTISGASLTNAGTIEATAADNSNIDAFTIRIQSGGTYGRVVNSGTITVAASDDSEADINLYGSSIVNSGSLTATATGDSEAYLDVEAFGSGASITNGVSKTIEASAGADSYTDLEIGGENDTTNGPVAMTNTSATLEAAGAGGGTAYLDLGVDDGTSVVGGTLKTTGAGYIGAFDDNASATSVTIAADSNIVAFYDGTLTLNDISGPIAPGTLLQAAYSGDIGILGNVNNGGTIEALAEGGRNDEVEVYISAGPGGLISNTGTMESVASGARPYTADIYAELTVLAGTGGTVINKGTILASTTQDYFEGAEFTVDGGAVTNAGTMAVRAASTAYDEEDTNYGAIYASSVVNTGSMQVSASDDSEADFYIEGTTSGASFTNSGTMIAAGLDESGAYFSIDGGTIRNARTMTALASVDGSEAAYGLYGGSAGTVSNTGTLLASAGEGEAHFSVDGGFVTNAKNATVEALASDDSLASAGLYGLGSGGSDTGTVTNSGAMLASATGDSRAYFQLRGGTVTNAAGATITVFATSASEQTYAGLDGIGTGGSDIGTVINSGALLVSANDNSRDDVGIAIDGGIITNAASGTIKAFATNYSDAYLGIDSPIPDGVITNSGTVLVSATASSEADVYFSLDGATVINAKTIVAVATAQGNASAQFYGANVVNSGTIAAIGAPDSDAYVELEHSTVNNTSGLVSAAGNGLIELDDATLSGGTLRTSGAEAAVVVGSGETGEIEAANLASGTDVFVAGASLTLGNGVVIASGALVQAAGEGEIVVAGGATITDFGTLLAGDHGPGTIVISGGVASGLVHIGQDGVVDVVSGGSANILFDLNENNGVLQIADSAGANVSAFTGTVYGFGGFAGEFPNQLIDLVNVGVTSSTLSNFSAGFSGNDLGGELIVTSGGSANVVAKIALAGYYLTTTFDVVNDGGTLAIADPLSTGGPPTLAATGSASSPTTGTGSVALLGSYMASLFASPEGQVGGQTRAETAQSEAVITHPHAT